MNFHPKVSIIIPVYNGANFIRQAIDSALAQTYDNIEIIVVNDGSSDEGATERIAFFYGDKIRYFSKENGGVATALNMGIEKMKGAYFSWLSHDDVYLPQKIETQINFLSEQNNTKIILYSDFVLINQDNKILEAHVSNFSPDQFLLELIYNSFLHGCSLLIPEECFETVGVFDPGLRTTQDYTLWVQMAQKYDFVHIPQILIHGRVHSEQGILKMHDLHFQELEDFYLWFLERLPLDSIYKFYPSHAVFFYRLFCIYEKRKFLPRSAEAARKKYLNALEQEKKKLSLIQKMRQWSYFHFWQYHPFVFFHRMRGVRGILKIIRKF